MNFLKMLSQPEYVYRPGQILHRFRRSFGRSHGPSQEVTLPWGATLRINTGEYIGSIIWHRGVFDLIVLEAIARLIEPGEVALDVGANIGQMTSLMCCKLGPKGRVLAFEPHPEIFAELVRNVGPLRDNPRCGQIVSHEVAVSDFEGTARLEVGNGWIGNQGLAKLARLPGGTAEQLKVRVATLDGLVGSKMSIGVCKLDVEGHELKVLHGAFVMLEERRIRDLVFEDLGPYPTPVQEHLVERGFTLFSLHRCLRRPVLKRVLDQPNFVGEREGANFLATLDPQRALARFRAGGWEALRGTSESSPWPRQFDN